MSRSYRRPSDYSRASSPRVDRSLSVTEASFQNLGLSETAGAQQLSVPSPYHNPDSRRRRPSNLRSELGPTYLPSQYDPSGYHRTASPASFQDLQPASPFRTSLLDPEDYQLFPGTADFGDRASPFSNTLPRSAMGYPKNPNLLRSLLTRPKAIIRFKTQCRATAIQARMLRPSLHLSGVCSRPNSQHRIWFTSLRLQAILKLPYHAVCLVPLAPAYCQARPIVDLGWRSARLLGSGGETFTSLAVSQSFFAERRCCRAMRALGRAR